MAVYFTKGKYQTSIISREFFEKWKQENPQYSDVEMSKWKRYWKYLREEIYQCAVENPEGLDLPFYLGNLSVRILDIDFKCAKDFNKTTVINKETGNIERMPFVTSDIPKKPKITWKKHKLFLALPALFGAEMSRACKKAISAGIRDNLFRYQKAFHHPGVKSKCEDNVEKGLYDD